jgi:hypothetical protein
MVQSRVELVHGVGSKRVAHLWSIDGDSHRPVGLGAVVRDVREVEPRDLCPCIGIEELRDHGDMFAPTLRRIRDTPVPADEHGRVAIDDEQPRRAR